MTEMPETPEERDARAVRAVRAGRREAFAELVHRHQERVHRLCVRVLGSEDDALDAVQDAFARALVRLHTLDEPRYFGTWLYRIALNGACTARRARKRAPEALVDPDGASAPADVRPAPGETAAARELSRVLREALDELPEAQRLAVALCDLEGHSYAAIATLLAISKGTVMSRIHYGRQRLRAILERRLGR